MNDTFETVLDDITGSYRQAQVLFTAVRLDLFSQIGAAAMSAAEIAAALIAPERPVRILCDALVSLGLLRKEGAVYSNLPAGLEFLSASGSQDKRPIILHNAALYERWAGLEERFGRTRPGGAKPAGMAPSKADFARAMAASAQTAAHETADVLDLAGVARLLDIGGGPGVYAIEFARRHPQLTVDVLDDEETLQVAAANIAQAGLAGRINCIPGNAFSAALQERYEWIFISNVIHMYDEDNNRALISLCRELLNAGGKLCIKDFFLDDSHTQPQWNALFAVNMLVNTEGGDCYTWDQVETWLKQQGLTPAGRREITPRSGMVFARRP